MKEITKEKEAELQMLDTQARIIGQELDQMDSSLMEIDYVKESLDDLSSTKEGTEVLSPISNGIFVKTKLDKNSILLVNVGKGVVVEKSVEDTKILLDEKLKEISEARDKLMEEMKKIEDNLIQLGED